MIRAIVDLALVRSHDPMDSGDTLTVDPYFPVPNAVEPVPIKWRTLGIVMTLGCFLFDSDSPVCYTWNI